GGFGGGGGGGGWTGAGGRLPWGARGAAARAEAALGLLGPGRCTVCPRLCKVNRLADQHGLCAIGRQAVVSWQVHGEPVTPKRLAATMLALQHRGCHNINFVTPEHVVLQILQALPLAIEAGLRLPIVYNTSAYDSLDTLRLIEGIV